MVGIDYQGTEEDEATCIAGPLSTTAGSKEVDLVFPPAKGCLDRPYIALDYLVHAYTKPEFDRGGAVLDFKSGL